MAEGARLREHIKQDLAAEVLRTTGQVQLAAFGYGMLPSFWPGDVLTIERRAFEHIRPVDIVLFSREERLFIHRVVRVEPDLLVTRGDAMPSEDAPVSPAQLMGIVTSVRGADGRSLTPPVTSRFRRWLGLALAYSGKLRSLALRWHRHRCGHIGGAGSRGAWL